MKAQATSANIQTWLESKDPRLVAWGAYFARENNDTAALDLAAQLVKKSLYQGGPDLLSAGGPSYDALSEILDALIQRRVLLSSDLLGYVSRSHPVQTIILLSMLPSAEQTGNLMQWYYGPRPDDGSNQLDRVSAMLLSKSPPPGFAANILANSEESLAIYIVSTKDMGAPMAGKMITQRRGAFCSMPAAMPGRMEFRSMRTVHNPGKKAGSPQTSMLGWQALKSSPSKIEVQQAQHCQCGREKILALAHPQRQHCRRRDHRTSFGQ